ncbi:MAG: ABC transporter permease [Anaerolineales bacterium]|nr:ABC transporter permease [Anaerolineales bacterium]
MRSLFNKLQPAVIASLGLALILLMGVPLLAIVLRALGFGGVSFSDQQLLSAVGLSFLTTGLAILLIFLLGTPVAYFLARRQFRFKRVLTVLIELPIILPPTVAGLALLLALGRRGLLGDALGSLGISLPFTTAAVVIAQVFVAAPFYIRAAQAGFQAVPDSVEEAARIDGATNQQVFTRVTFPLAANSVLTGLSLSWARALGEFGASLMFAGNISGRTQTMTLFIYNAFESNLDAAIAASLILMGLGYFTLYLSHRLAAPHSEPWFQDG